MKFQQNLIVALLYAVLLNQLDGNWKLFLLQCFGAFLIAIFMIWAIETVKRWRDINNLQQTLKKLQDNKES